MQKQTDKTPSTKRSKITTQFERQGATSAAGQKNEGEGSSTGTKKYDAGVREFVKSGAVEPAAKEAEQAIDGAEGAELTEAETIGKRGGKDAEGPTRGRH